MCPLAEVRAHHCIADHYIWSASEHISLALIKVAIHTHRWEARGSGHGFDGGSGAVEPGAKLHQTAPQLGSREPALRAGRSFVPPYQRFPEQPVKIDCMLWILGGWGTSCYQNAWANFKSIHYA